MLYKVKPGHVQSRAIRLFGDMQYQNTNFKSTLSHVLRAKDKITRCKIAAKFKQQIKYPKTHSSGFLRKCPLDY